jgi:ABC-type molybdate transport system substrate-binding protein
MEDLLSAGQRKKIKAAAIERKQAEEAEIAKAKKNTYDVGSTSYEITQRLKRMEELEAEGKVKQSKQAKKDLWAKLSDQAKKKFEN